jgi:hypothetical protein
MTKLELVFTCNSDMQDKDNGFFWSLYLDDKNSGKGLVFYTYSDMVSPASESYDVLKFILLLYLS